MQPRRVEVFVMSKVTPTFASYVCIIHNLQEQSKLVELELFLFGGEGGYGQFTALRTWDCILVWILHKGTLEDSSWGESCPWSCALQFCWWILHFLLPLGPNIAATYMNHSMVVSVTSPEKNLHHHCMQLQSAHLVDQRNWTKITLLLTFCCYPYPCTEPESIGTNRDIKLSNHCCIQWRTCNGFVSRYLFHVQHPLCKITKWVLETLTMAQHLF